MNICKHLFYIFVGFLLSTVSVDAAEVPSQIGFSGEYPDGTIVHDSNITLIGILWLIQWFLLKVALPILLVGTSIYIAYELFTAEGDETKMKKAWKSFAYSVVWLVSIAVSYAFVTVISRLAI